MANPVIVGATVGTTIMPGAGTVIGAAAGGLVGLFSGPEAQQQQASIGGRTIDARQIWEQIHTGNSDSLYDGASAASSLQSVHDERSTQIDAINQAMDAAWQGDASAQVQAGAHPLGIWLRDSSSNLQKSGTYLNNQGEAFGTAHSTVQEIAATPPHAGFMDNVNPFSDKDEEIEKYNEQGQTNVQAFNAYYQASAQNAAGMPQYSAWQGNNFSESNGPDKNGTDRTGTDRTSTMPSGNPGAYQPGSTGNLPGTSTGNIPGYNTNLPSTNLPGIGSGEYQPSYPGPGSSSWNDGTAAAGYTPSTSGTDFGSSNFGPSGSGSGLGGGSGSGGGFGAGGVGSLGAAGFGPGGSGSLGAGSSTGSGAAAGGAAGAGRGGVGAGGAGAAGRAGAGGMAGMGGAGGRGKGGDDDEHQTKYLVSEDPNSLFGTDELTAPPVIGE